MDGRGDSARRMAISIFKLKSFFSTRLPPSPQLIVVNYKNTHDKIYFPLGSLIFNLLASGSKQIFINLRGRGIKIISLNPVASPHACAHVSH